MDQNRHTGVAEIELRVPGPLIDVAALLGPTKFADDVDPSIAIHIARAHAMAGRFFGELVLLPSDIPRCRWIAFELIPGGITSEIGQYIRLTIGVHVSQHGRLHRP